MRIFLRQTSLGREPLAVAMTGVRMGERLLQIGLNDPLVLGALAAKPGLSGESTIVVTDEATAVRARQATAEAGALVEVRVHSLESLPFEKASFDVAVIHNRDGLLTTHGQPGGAQALGECWRVLRPGGRVLVLEKGSPSGLAAFFGSRQGSSESSEAALAVIRGLETAGFRGVRTLGDRDNYRFIEGMKGDLPK